MPRTTEHLRAAAAKNGHEGGLARALQMTPEEREEAAIKAGRASLMARHARRSRDELDALEAKHVKAIEAIRAERDRRDRTDAFSHPGERALHPDEA